MEVNESLRKLVLLTVDNQLRSNNPPETKITFDRLIKDGYTKYDAKQYIGQCLAIELYNILKFKESFNLERYIKNLNKLPN